MEELVRFGISMNAQLLAKFDEAIARRGYSNRSEAIRDLIRNYLVEEEWQDGDAEVAGTVTLVYDHHSSVSEVLRDLQHDHHAHVVSTLHVHQDADHCLEVVVLRGRARHIKELADRLIALKGVKIGRLTIATTGKELP
ncbi:MAG TPA: nickel-responsive transcriptional regulator NikR [Symbiobacteriaceae bacterium]